MSFESLGLSAPILKALKACDYRQPTPIQKQSIPPALQGRDVLGCAQTGTGKTCAFGTPILQRLSQQPAKGKGVRALILTPTRELAIQIGENLEAYGTQLPLTSAVIFGGVGQAPQVEALKKGVDILTATPGRLLDLHNQGLLNLSKVEIFVLDEADRMLDMGFIHDVRKVVAMLPEKKQTLFFSATMPEEIMDLVNSLMKNPVQVAVNPVSSPVEVINQRVYLLDRKNKTKLLAKLLVEENVKNALVFTRTKHGADKVTRELVKEDIRVAAIHGNKSQTARQQALAQFKKGKIQVLVATDIAARGLDIEELSHVFNYNLPEVPETYIHRIGRTGRAGHGGTAVSFCDFSEEPLLRGIEALLGKQVPRIDGHPWPMEVFEVPKRDAKGRVVNEDDEEARRAAREKRMEKAQVAKGQKAPEETKRPARQPQKAALVQSKPVPAAQEAPVQKALSRRNPLDGDVILDATARLLAPRTLSGRRPAAPSSSHKEAKPTDRSRQPKGPIAGKGQAVSKTDSAPEGNRHQRRRPEQEGLQNLNLSEKKNSPAPPAAGKKKGKEQTRPLLHSEARGRGTRRMAPPVEGNRSNQKDSTEQPSLMKPFYIDHD